jgi:hypothetical protein
MKLGYYGRTPLLLNAAAECPLVRVQGDMKPRHLLLKPTNTDPTEVYQLLAQYLLSRTQPILLTQEECIWHLLIIWYIRLGSVPTASLRLLRRRRINPVTSAIFPIQGWISADRFSSESRTPPASLWYLRNLPISHRDPDCLVSDIENFLHGHLKLTSLSYTKLKTKFISYSAFRVTYDEFSRVNENEALPNRCLIAPFYARRRPEQVFAF